MGGRPSPLGGPFIFCFYTQMFAVPVVKLTTRQKPKGRSAPSIADLALPLLKAIKDGKSRAWNEASQRASEISGFDMAADGNDRIMKSRMRRARNWLALAGLVEVPDRGFVKITKRGAEVLAEKPPKLDKKYLSRFPEFVGRTEDSDAGPPRVPTVEGLMLPLLEAVKDGVSYQVRDASERASEILGLSRDARNAVMPGRTTTTVHYRLGWARHYLKRAGLLEAPSYGLVKITGRGLEVLAENPTSIDKKYLSKFGPADNAEDPGVVHPAGEDSSETPEDTMRRGLAGMRGRLYQDLKEELERVSPAGFEKLVLDVCKNMGYGDMTRHTGESGDRGIDGIIREDKLGLGEIYIQAKRWGSSVRAKDVRDFVGALAATSTKKGIFITTSSFTADARAAADTLKDGTRVILIDGDMLVRLMDESGTGVVGSTAITINRVDREYFTQFD